MSESWLFLYTPTYRKKHTILAGEGGDLTNYQIELTVDYGSGVDSGDTVYVDGKCKTDFGDVRFTDEDNTVMYDYWLKAKVDGDYAEFVVEVADDLASDINIYVYYGCPASTSVSDQDATFVDVIDGGVSAWRFDEPSGDVAFDDMGVNNGTLVNSPSWVDGKYGKALSFVKASSQYVNCGQDSSLDMDDTDQVTLLARIYITELDGTFRPIIEASYSTPTRNGYYLAIGTNNKLLGAVWNNGVQKHIYGNTVLTVAHLNKWVHVLFVADGRYTKIYLDGVLDGSTDWTAYEIGANSVDLLIGRYTTLYFNGIIDDVRIFNRALSATEGLEVYENYCDTTLEVGSVLVRKYATTTLPTHSTWEAEENIYDLTGTAAVSDVLDGKTFYSTTWRTQLTGTYVPITPTSSRPRTIYVKDPEQQELLEDSLMLNAVLSMKMLLEKEKNK